ncbi:nucleoside 2-deoxyribosyltransferase [bacterium]|nr:nucleoside 2-deoxyribosyltransferase [bacterium]
MMTGKIQKCKFCGTTPEKVMPADSGTDAYEVHCIVCGIYRIIGTAYSTTLKDSSSSERILFSGFIRNHSSYENPLKLGVKDIENISSTVAPLKNISLQDKINSVLFDIYSKASSLESKIEINLDEYTKYYLPSRGDYVEILNHLQGLGYLGRKVASTNKTPGIIRSYTYELTINGWKRYEELQQTNKDSKAVFVAMSFDKKLKEIYEKAIQPACDHCGFRAFRVDSEEHNEKVCDKIIAGIKKSRFLIADFTQNKHGVYFEAGYALGLGIPVIWTCNEKEVENLHFDTRQYNHIAWKDFKDYEEKLINRIEATIK